MERLICSKAVGDFRIGDVMPYTDPIDVTILTTLGIAKVEQFQEPKNIDLDTVIVGDVTPLFAERPAPPRDPDEDEDDDELRMENPDPAHPAPTPSPTNPPNQPPPSPAPTAWDDDEDEFVSRRGLKAEHGHRPRSPEEYHTRVMNEERSQNKKRRTRTPK
jgi:hypothetical protein